MQQHDSLEPPPPEVSDKPQLAAWAIVAADAVVRVAIDPHHVRHRLVSREQLIGSRPGLGYHRDRRADCRGDGPDMRQVPDRVADAGQRLDHRDALQPLQSVALQRMAFQDVVLHRVWAWAMPSSRKNQPPIGIEVKALVEASGQSWIRIAANSPTRNGSGLLHRPVANGRSQASARMQNSTRPGAPDSTHA